jgi:hypothetical protein
MPDLIPFGPPNPALGQPPSWTFPAAGVTTGAKRSMPDRLIDIVNVKDFGALGDNSHDDTANIQAAIDYMNVRGKGTLFFPPGTYRVTEPIYLIRWNEYSGGSVNFVGAGRDATILRGNIPGDLYSHAPTIALLVNQDAAGVAGDANRWAVLENLTIWNESTVPTSYCFHSSGDQLNLINNCRFKGLNGTNTILSPGGGMHIGNCIYESLSIPRADATTGGATIPGANNYIPTGFIVPGGYDPCTNYFTVGAFIHSNFIGNQVIGFDVGLVAVPVARAIIGNTFSRCRTAMAMQPFAVWNDNTWW